MFAFILPKCIVKVYKMGKSDMLCESIFRNVIFYYFRRVMKFGYSTFSGVAKSAGDSININKNHLCL